MNELYDSDWLQEQLAHTLTLLEGAWASLPEERWAVLPPERIRRMSSWPAQLHLYHLYQYERITVGIAATWLEGGVPLSEAEEAALVAPYRAQEEGWQQLSGAATMAGMREERQKLRAQLARATDWDTVRDVLFGTHNLRWVVAKSVQHTIEHTTTLMQLALFWERTGFRGG